ncbi:hypothetical protein [Mycobacterium uberis]|uniref:hypothetical protein n=1 Tax=Mycobacterium uberis TaxID=2162698 RepID=UPI001A9F87BF|nr:hypothetical protein [Mycobacterium uberis]
MRVSGVLDALVDAEWRVLCRFVNRASLGCEQTCDLVLLSGPSPLETVLSAYSMG